MTPQQVARFLSHVDRGDESGCWTWTGCKTTNGYGRTSVGVAHKRWWEHLHGPVPTGMVLDHICHQAATCPGGVTCPHRACVRPDHLIVTTQAANVRRAAPALKTVCGYGHSRWGSNGKAGRRYCLDCHADRQRARYVRVRHLAERIA